MCAQNLYICSVFFVSMKSGNHRRTEKIWFNQTGIGGTDKKNAKGWKIRTLSSLFKEFDDTEVRAIVFFLNLA